MMKSRRPQHNKPADRSKPAGKSGPPVRGYAGRTFKGEPTAGPGTNRRKRRTPVRTNDQPGERLQKVLAAAGIASRRECETLILEGRVEVDGKVIRELGTRVESQEQDIRVDGEALRKPKLAYYAVHKPSGVVSTSSDPSGRPRVTDLLPPSLGRLYNVGRLDMASEGLILVTNDGDLANRLTHPRHGVEKTYLVQVAGHPEPEVLVQLRKGVFLAEGKANVVGARIKSRRKMSTLLEIVLSEGRNREIRRLLARVGHKVQRLTRVAVGPVKLADMPAGAYRRLTSQEVSALKKAASGTSTEGRERNPPAPASGKMPR